MQFSYLSIDPYKVNWPDSKTGLKSHHAPIPDDRCDSDGFLGQGGITHAGEIKPASTRISSGRYSLQKNGG